jgi:NAD(P)-dependent dehydrogenase (short-subunit alcohol dehydrogenase family)
MAMMSSYEGKTVIVTGANSGIGEATVVAFAQAGANAFGIARATKASDEARARHPEVRWLAADVVNPDEVETAIARAVDETGRIDTLVNNAGIFELLPLEDSSEEMIRRHFEINVLGLIRATKLALPALISSRGTIVNISSVVGHRPAAGGSVYAATKAAVESLTQSWALELAPKGVRVNSVAPGPIDTPGFRTMPPETVAAMKAQLTARTPLGRMASADEVARWIVTIADPSVTWLTGEILAFDGGFGLT